MTTMQSVSYEDLLDALEVLENETIQIQRDGRHWRVSANAPVERLHVQHYNRRGQPVDGDSDEIAFCVNIITCGDEFVEAYME